jgi:drug/metabolite transporter (DMT)-like permease
VPLFLLATAVVLAPMAVWRYTPPHWTTGVLAMLAYMGLVPTLLAYGLWDRAVRHGNIVLVASFSYVTPLLSSFLSAAIWGVWPRPWFWLACVLTIAGAWVCSRSVHEGTA